MYIVYKGQYKHGGFKIGFKTTHGKTKYMVRLRRKSPLPLNQTAIRPPAGLMAEQKVYTPWMFGSNIMLMVEGFKQVEGCGSGLKSS